MTCYIECRCIENETHFSLFWYHNNFVTERDERWYRGELSPILVDAESWQGSRDFPDLMSKVCKESSFLAHEILLVEVKMPEDRHNNKQYLLRSVEESWYRQLITQTESTSGISMEPPHIHWISFHFPFTQNDLHVFYQMSKFYNVIYLEMNIHFQFSFTSEIGRRCVGNRKMNYQLLKTYLNT